MKPAEQLDKLYDRILVFDTSENPDNLPPHNIGDTATANRHKETGQTTKIEIAAVIHDHKNQQYLIAGNTVQ